MPRPRTESRTDVDENFLVLAIDIGTSSSRTALFSEHGRRLPKTTASQHYSVRYDRHGAAELSPFALHRAVAKCRSETLQAHACSRFKKIPIAAIGGSSLWHGLLGLDRNLKPITPVFTWADSRAHADAAVLQKRLLDKEIQQRTGCMLRAPFWPAKLRWLARTQPALFRRVRRWVSPSDWIFFRLFGQLRCSASMASGTGLYNLTERSWDDELLDICRVERPLLPEIAGRLEPSAACRHNKPLIFCPIGDGAASNLGSAAGKSTVAINVGTSAAVRIVQNESDAAATKLPPGLFRYVIDEKRTVFGGATSNAGNLREWCLRELQVEKNKSTARILVRRSAANDTLTVLPFWVAERAPTWPANQFGVIDGFEQSTTAAEIFRAATVSVFYRLGQILELIEATAGRAQSIIVSGGIVHSAASIHLLADSLGRDVYVAAEAEASLRGAALHALNQLGVQVPELRLGKRIRCDKGLAEKHRVRRERQTALEQALT